MNRPMRESRGRWIPNLEGGLLSFAIEVIVVLMLALGAVAIAGLALLII